jgi:heat shock protein HslJ
MRSFSPDGHDSRNVLDDEFNLHINGTKIQGEICNGFGGDIEYIDSSTFRGRQIFYTTSLCIGQDGPSIMEVESAFQDGMTNGLAVSEDGDTLVLRDIVTDSTFVYERTRSV